MSAVSRMCVRGKNSAKRRGRTSMFSVPLEVLTMAGLMVLVVIFLMAMFARLYRKAGPHEALVVYGFRGTRIVKGHGTIIFPMVELCRGLSLELMSFDV